MKPEKELLGVLLTPGPKGAPLGKVIRVHDVNKAIEKNVSPTSKRSPAEASMLRSTSR